VKNPSEIELTLVYKNGNEYFTEKVDAVKHGDYYQVKSVPAFAKNLAYGDIVQVECENGQFHFEALVEESGHSVIHIILLNQNSKENITSKLSGYGCGVNTRVAENYLVIDIPPLILYMQIKVFLEKERKEENIDYSEACLSKQHTVSF